MSTAPEGASPEGAPAASTQPQGTDALAIAQALIRCPSVTPDEAGALTYLETLLSAHGFACRRLVFSQEGTADVDNFYARIGDSGPHLCFAGHTDVVPPGDEARWTLPPFAGEIRDGALHGRGAADMKGGIAAFAAAAIAYLKARDGRPEGSLSFLITGDEEGVALNGTVKLVQWLKERGEHIDHCLVGEPTSVRALGDTIKIGRRGTLSGTIAVHGRQGHVAYPHLASNPIPRLLTLMAALTAAPLDDGSAHFQPSNLEFVSVDVGNPAWNVIPARAEARFNIRYNDRWTGPALKDHVAALLRAAGGGIDHELTFEPVPGDVFVTGGGILTELASEAIEAVTGRKAELSTSGGTSDARFIKDLCPVIEFGLVGATIHQVDEHVPLADLEALTAIYGRLIEAYFARAGRLRHADG